MGCAGSNPLPGADPTANGRASSPAVNAPMQQASDPDSSFSIVQKMAGNANVDEMVKKIQDVTGSMENLMDETHEKLSSLFGKVEQKAEDTENAVEDVVNDSTSTMPEKPRINDVIFLTVQETRVIPIGIIDENDPVIERNEKNEEKVKTEHVDNEENKKLNDLEDKEDNKNEELEE